MVSTRLAAAAVATTLFAVVTHGTQRGADAAPSIIGVWRISEITTPGPTGATTTNAGPNIQIFSARHYSVTTIRDAATREESPAARSADGQTAR